MSNLSVDTKSLALFGLSNIAAGTEFQVTALLQERNLVNKIIELASEQDFRIASEAKWVLGNTISEISTPNLREFY